MGHRLEEALNDCLERMADGESIDKCVERYPQHRDELLPLLSTARMTTRAARSNSYRVGARYRGLDAMMQAYSEGRMNRRNRFSLPFLQPLARPVLVGFVAVFLTAVAAGGSTMASDSVPGDPLYMVKKTKENVTLMMPGSDIDKAKAHARLAGTRAEEIETLVERNRIRDARRMTRMIEHHLNEAASYAGVALFDGPVDFPRGRNRHNMGELRRSLERDVRLMRARMEQHAERAPKGSRVEIIRIMQRSDLDYRIVIHAMDDGDSAMFWRNQPATLAGLR